MSLSIIYLFTFFFWIIIFSKSVCVKSLFATSKEMKNKKGDISPAGREARKKANSPGEFSHNPLKRRKGGKISASCDP